MNYGKNETEKKIRTATSSKKKYQNKFFLGFFKTFVLFMFAFCIIGASVGIGMFKGIIDSAPDVDIESIVPQGYATTVYDSQGNLTDTLVTTGSNRDPATYDELPQDLIDAFVAIEDARFWTHNGIDLRSIMRAVKGVLTGDSSAGGGSTLTQQLIKNNVFGGGREASFGEKIERKFQEQYLAVQLTKNMDRRLIITNYLNTINLGQNALGVKVAARRYFDKEVSELTLSECTVLAGITQNPSRLNPVTGQKANEEKRKVILQYMFEQGYITKEEQEEALADDVYSRIQNVDLLTKENVTPYSYFTDELISQVKDALMKELGYSETQAHNLIYSGGLQIHTTQDPAIQAIVDAEVNNPENYTVTKYSMEYRLSVTHADGTTTHYSQEHIKTWHKEVLKDSGFDALYDTEDEARADAEAYKAYLLKEGDTVIGESVNLNLQPQVSFVIMDQATGEVKAISGGRGEKKANLTLNRATNVPRQPGSTFKVITSFAPALDSCGATLGTVYYDTSYTIGQKTFRNWYGQKFQGYSNIRDGIIYSMNIVAVRCMMETVTAQLGIEYAKNFGITTLTADDVNASAALGGLSKGVTNLELTAAFASIANGGMYTEPVFFTKILDHNGKVLISNEPETHRVLKDSTAFLLTDALSESMESRRSFASAGTTINSTSTRANFSGMSTAGKSGTTTNNVDVWFVGFTPYYTAGVWGGCDMHQTLNNNGGTSYHKDIWRKIMTKIHEGMSDPGFQVPATVEQAQICRKSGKLALSGVCTADPRGNAVYTEYFAKGTVPTEVCDVHVSATVCAESGLLPTEYCPEKVTRVFISIPAGEHGHTDDSNYTLPGSQCTIHTQSSTIITPPEDNLTGPGQVFGPGYVPSGPGAGGSSGSDSQTGPGNQTGPGLQVSPNMQTGSLRSSGAP